MKVLVSISENYFEYIIAGMERVVEGFKGTARNSKITNLKICGKTGTVENYKNGVKQKDHSVFIAFSPKKNPKIAIAVFIENGYFMDANKSCTLFKNEIGFLHKLQFPQ